jgi:hypothetical protein
MRVDWQNGLRLVGHDGWPDELQRGETVAFDLQWSTTRPITDTYTIFTHLVGPDGQLVAQNDRQPEAGFYPTWGWDVGESVLDRFDLTIPAGLPEGDYRLVIGWYNAQSGERLRLADGGDGWELAQWILP